MEWIFQGSFFFVSERQDSFFNAIDAIDSPAARGYLHSGADKQTDFFPVKYVRRKIHKKLVIFLDPEQSFL
ncbi:hypothetical protein B1222_13210 [Paenibacillus larvae subsp. pulvifaciens]|nr:hypothetical protein B1222_13210 [Paenibacillus larvae subsp. pulvifaciens]